VPKGKKSKRRKLATIRSAKAQIALAKGVLVFVPRDEIIARQLDTAIYLWFTENDQVSTLVLGVGAHRNLDEIAGESGKGPTMKSLHGKRIYDTFDAFRHGTSHVDFVPELTEDMLLDAVLAFDRFYGFRTAFMSTFGSFLVLHSNLKQEPGTEAFFEGLLIKDVRHLSRQEFFTRVVPVFAKVERTTRTKVSRELRGR
jgi:hypothetical protein